MNRPVTRPYSPILRCIVGFLVAITLYALPASAGAGSTVTTGTTVTDTYSYTGNTETLTVPANVYQLSVTVTGA